MTKDQILTLSNGLDEAGCRRLDDAMRAARRYWACNVVRPVYDTGITGIREVTPNEIAVAEVIALQVALIAEYHEPSGRLDA